MGPQPGETLKEYHDRLVQSATATIEAAIASEHADGILPDSFVVLIEQRVREMAEGTVHVTLFAADDLARTLDTMGVSSIRRSRWRPSPIASTTFENVGPEPVWVLRTFSERDDAEHKPAKAYPCRM